MAENGGIIGLSDLAQRSGLAVPTIHRLMRTMVDLGYARQEPSRKYALGPRLVALGESASGLVGTWAIPHLDRIVEQLGESANLAMLDGHEVLYVAQSPGRHAMRMVTEVGRRAATHCTAVGKVILAHQTDERVDDILRRGGMASRTPNTLTAPELLKAELVRIRERGYATDEEEQELGVRCVGVAVPGKPVRAAVSISGPVGRMNDGLVGSAVPLLSATATDLAAEFAFAHQAAASRD